MKFTEEEFDKREGTYLVKFGAPWCGQCRLMEPVIEEMVNDGYSVYEVNTDENQELAIRFGIRSVPTTILVRDREVVDTKIGAQSKQDLLNLLGE